MSELMERAVPAYPGTGDWDAVLRDAGASRRRARLRPALAFAVIAAALVVAWQAASTSTLDRALAAAGDGRVLHLVFEGSLPKQLVNLETGERTVLRGRHEVWFEPGAGARERETFDGVVQWDAHNDSPHGRAIYASLGAGYRDALRSGQAKVVGETASVYWIRISEGHDVAVSRESYRPVSIRVGGMPETRIVTYETLRSMPPQSEPSRGADRVPSPGRRISLREARRVLGAAPVWAGDGRPVVRSFGEHGVWLESRDVAIAQGRGEEITALAGVLRYVPPEGSLLLEGTIGLVRHGDLTVAIHALDEAAILTAARALRPYTAP